jgi:hypothetical protein
VLFQLVIHLIALLQAYLSVDLPQSQKYVMFGKLLVLNCLYSPALTSMLSEFIESLSSSSSSSSLSDIFFEGAFSSDDTEEQMLTEWIF